MIHRQEFDRPSKHQYLMNIAEAVKTRSHDAQTQFGVVFVKKDTDIIVSTGYNGFIRGAQDDVLPNMRPEKYRIMVHAEVNAICAAARKGISLDGCYMVCRGSPCENCSRCLWQVGIETVIIKEFHATFELVKTMPDLDVNISYLIDGFIRLDYFPKATKLT